MSLPGLPTTVLSLCYSFLGASDLCAAEAAGPRGSSAAAARSHWFWHASELLEASAVASATNLRACAGSLKEAHQPFLDWKSVAAAAAAPARKR